MSLNLRQQLLNKLLNRRVVTETNCWLYTGPSGVIKREIFVKNRNQLVHRISAFIYLNFNLDNRLICHTCRTDYCWNPEHLYIGDTSTNTRDAIKDGTFRNPNLGKKFCKYGHKLSGLNLYIYKDKDGFTHRWCRICRARLSNG